MKEKLLMASGAILIIISTLMLSGILPQLVFVITGVEIIPQYPKDGDSVAGLHNVNVEVKDPYGAYPSAVYFAILGQNISMRKTIGIPTDSCWAGTLSPAIYTGGTHQFKISVLSAGGYTFSKVCTVTITSTPLTGKWYINDIEVTSPDQTLVFSTTLLNFKFVKTAGTCKYVQVGWVSPSPEIGQMDLTQTATDVWTGSKDFYKGKWNLMLEASDGATLITLSIFSDFLSGSEPPIVQGTLPTLTLFVIGIALFVPGVYLEYKKKR